MTSRGRRHIYFGSDTYVGGETGFMLSQPLLVSCVACGVQHNGESGSGNHLQEVLPHCLFVVCLFFFLKKSKTQT